MPVDGETSRVSPSTGSSGDPRGAPCPPPGIQTPGTHKEPVGGAEVPVDGETSQVSPPTGSSGSPRGAPPPPPGIQPPGTHKESVGGAERPFDGETSKFHRQPAFPGPRGVPPSPLAPWFWHGIGVVFVAGGGCGIEVWYWTGGWFWLGIGVVLGRGGVWY